ncbi:MAG TPA: PQQ-binding-like beta-propeller repeat protein [Candidatus Limnocylindria bacterium]|jgi:outer membrane protein assembly factor BamB|nr:PQQ-binding-like beta-propeller repeat protein [Candidatus Limnocylindria bacterium]
MRKLLLLMLASAGLQAADWPRFRGPNGDGVVADAKLPTKLDAQSIAWTASLPGRGLSSPIIIGDRLFVTCSSGPRQDRLHVLCFNVADGSLRWERQLWATGRTMTHEKISAAAPSPTSDGKYIYAIFSSNDCAALDFDGNLIWYRGLGRDYPNASNSLGMASSLLVVDGVLIAQVENDSESFTAGLDSQTGVNRWKLDRPKRANWTSPTLVKGADGKPAVVIQSFKGLTAISPKDGRTLWTYDDGASTVPTLTTSEGRLYVPSQGITVLEPSAGPAPKKVWNSAQLRPGTSSPLVVGQQLFTLNDGGILTCANTSDGKRQWQMRLKGPFTATPLGAGGYLYCVNENGLIQVVDPSKPDGVVVGELDLGQPIIGTPSIGAGSLFVRSDAKLWRIGTASTL